MRQSAPTIYGRDKEFALLDKLVTSDFVGLKLVLISGVGGIGKTTLLNAYQKIVSSNHPQAMVVPIVDLADPLRRPTESIMNSIARALDAHPGQHVFGPYYRDLDDLDLMEASNVGSDIISYNRGRLTETFTRCYNLVTSPRKTVILLDSAEYLVSEDGWDSIFSLVRGFKHTILIVAGRPAGIDLARTWAKARLRISQITSRVLEPLKQADAQELLNKRGGGVSRSLAQKIHWLAQGNPILLALAADWLRRGLDLPELVSESYSRLQQDPNEKLRQEFGQALVGFLLKPQSDIDQLILWMGHIEQRFDIELIQFLTGYSESKSRQLVTELSRIDYVKTLGNKLVLHEDVVSLIRNNIWNQLDPYKSQRQSLSQKVAKFLNGKISKLAEDQMAQRTVLNTMVRLRKSSLIDLRQYRLSQELLKEYRYAQVFYDLDFDKIGAFRHFIEAYDSTGDIYYQADLLDLVRRIEDQLTNPQRFEISQRRGKHLLGNRIFDKAKVNLDQWMDVSDLTTHQQIELLSGQANYHRIIGDLPKALEIIEVALRLAVTTSTAQAIPQLTQTKGFFLRLMGRWEQAIECYEEAIKAMPRISDQDKLLLSRTINNLAFVYGACGRWVTGLQWGEVALRIKQEVAGPSEIAASLVTLGSLFWAKGDYMKARQQYDQALELVELPFDSETQARAYFSYGIADWFAQELKDADVDFTTAIRIIQEHGHHEQLPLAVHYLGHIKWELGDLQQAEKLFLEGYELSKKRFDYQALVDTLVGLSELYQAQGRLDEINQYVNELRELESHGYRFPLFAGRMERILGQMAFDRGDYDISKNMFIQGLMLVAEHGGYGKYSLREEFVRFGHCMDKLPFNLVLDWCNTLESVWPKEKLDEGRQEMAAFVKARRVVAELQQV